MSQGATLYSITPEEFLRIEKANGKKIRPLDYSKEYVSFQGSFMALEYIVSKGKAPREVSLLEEIFNPKKTLGQKNTKGINFSNLSEDEKEDLYDFVYYLPPEKTGKINDILSTVGEDDVSNNYNAEELNNNGIYPEQWQDDDEQAFSRREIVADFIALKKFFRQAAAGPNYILCYVG